MSDTAQPRLISRIPPVLHDAMDGGLGFDDIARDPGRRLVVQTGPWGDIQHGDVIDILWGPFLEVVASYHYSTADNASPYVYVEASRLARYGDGTMPLAAQLTLVVTGEVFRTDIVDVPVKLSVPGGHDPAAETIHLNEGLSAPLVSPSPLPEQADRATVTIPVYENMSVGDRITVQWQREFVRMPPLTADEVGKPVRIEIPPGVIAAATGGEVTVQYQIHDVVANWSLWSPATTVEVPPGDDAPEAPWLLGTVNDAGKEVDLAALGTKDLVVRVEGHAGRPGDSIMVTWAGTTALGKPTSYKSAPYTLQRKGQAIDVAIPNVEVIPLAAGIASASYVLSSPSGGAQQSRRRQVSILGQAKLLRPPRVVEAIEGILDPLAAGNGVHVSVDAWAGADKGDRCYLEWTGTRSDGTPTYYSAVLTGADVDNNRLVFLVPADETTRIAGGSLRVRYSIQLQATLYYQGELRSEPLAHLVSPWLDLTVAKGTAALSIDSTPVTLSGPLVRTEKPVTAPPAGTFTQRVATGGVPPYRYAASSGAVEVGAVSGRVIALRNGSADVTVTDAKGATASYSVQVSNVLHLVDVGGEVLWNTAVANAGNKGGRLPHVEEWDALRAAYGGAPGLRDNPAWTDSRANSVSHWVVFPNTGAKEARRSSLGRSLPDEPDPRGGWIPIGPKFGSGWVWMIIAPKA